MEIESQKIMPIFLYASLIVVAYIYLTGKFVYLLHNYVIPTGVAFLGLLIFIAWTYSNIKPGFPGRIVDTLIFYGFQGNLFRRYEGLMVDISDLINDRNLMGIKELVLNQLELEFQKEPDKTKKDTISKNIEIVKKIDASELRKHIWVYGTRRDFQRYVWVWIADAPIDEYAYSSLITTFNFPYGYLRRRAIFVLQTNLTKTVKMTGYGKVRVRVVAPILAPSETMKVETQIPEEIKEAVGMLGAAIHTASVMITNKKAIEKQLKAYKRANEEKDKKIAELTIERDIARNAASATNLYEITEEEKKLPQNQPKMPDYAIMLVTTILGMIMFGSLLPQYLHNVSTLEAALLGAMTFGLAFIIFVQKPR